MNLTNIFFSGTYSLPGLIISFIVTIIMFIVKRLAKNGIGTFGLTYLPFISGTILYALYSLIFLNGAILKEEVIGNGIMCGSLSTAFTVILKDVLSGINFRSLESSAIKGIVQNYVDEEKLEYVVKKIVGISKADKENAVKKTAELLTENLKTTTNISEIQDVAVLIIATINSLKTDK